MNVIFCLIVMDQKMLTINPMEEQIIERNTKYYNISLFVDNKCFLCEHEKLHPFTARKGKWISESMNRDIEKHSTCLT